MTDAGASEDAKGFGPAGAAPGWVAPVAIVVTVVVAFVAGMIAFTDTIAHDAEGRRAERARSEPVTTTAVSTTAAPATAVATTAAPATTAPATAVSTTAVSTTAVSTTAAPRTSAPSRPVTPTQVPAGTWVASVSEPGAFRVELPSPPESGSGEVRTTSGSYVRVEQTAEGPDASLVSVTSIAMPASGPSVQDFLASIAEQTRADLGGALTLGPAETRAGLPARSFRVDGGGALRSLVLYGNGRLYTVSIYRPAAMTVATDAAFERVVDSFTIAT